MQITRLLTIFLFAFSLQKILPAQIGSLDNTLNENGIIETNFSKESRGIPSILIQNNVLKKRTKC